MWTEKLVEQVFTLIEEHVGTWPALTPSIDRRLTEVCLCVEIADYAHTCVVKFHPFALTFYYCIVMAELQSLSLVYDKAL